jgi:glutathione S-transferase
MQLYAFPWGVYPRHVLIYLKEKGVTSIEMVEVDAAAGENRAPWFLDINPAGTVPVLRTDTGALVRETASILEYLEEVLDGPDLIGATPEARAHARDAAKLVHVAYAFCATYVAQLSPLLQARVTCSPGAIVAMREEFYRQLASLEGQANDDEYFGGAVPNIADISFFASAQYYDLFYHVPLSGRFPRLQAIYQRFSQRPSATPPDYPEALALIAPVRPNELANEKPA